MKKKWVISIIIILIILLLIGGLSSIYNHVEITYSTTTKEVEDDNPPKESDDDLIKNFQNEEYYLPKNLDRYLAYFEKYPEKSLKDIVSSVNVNIDRPFYTDIKKSNIEDGNLILVNKYYKLDSSYTPDLVEMTDNYSHAYTKKMQKVAYESLQEMVNAALLDNIILYDVSSYRSFSTQSILYQNYVKRDGKDAADTYSARAGHSEHQTGLATDLNTSSSKVHFEDSKEFAWLSENAYKYGFILRYPKDKEYLTGYKFEPWHYRYVGAKAATYIKEHDITFDEYYAFFIDK